MMTVGAPRVMVTVLVLEERVVVMGEFIFFRWITPLYFA
jgi:hypothetical protein